MQVHREKLYDHLAILLSVKSSADDFRVPMEIHWSTGYLTLIRYILKLI